MNLRRFLLAWMLLLGAVCAHGQVVLSLDDAVAMGLARNPSLQAMALDSQRARAEVNRAMAVEDTVLRLGAGWEDSELPPGSFPSAGGVQSGLAEIGLARRLTTGTDLEVRGETQRNRFDTGLGENDPTFRSLLEVRLSQSLGRNRFGESDRSRRQAAEAAVDIAAWRWNRERERLAAAIHDGWWAAYARQLWLETLERAEARRGELVDDLREKVADGLVDETEALAAEAALAGFRVEVLSAQNLAAEAIDQVKALLMVDRREWDEVELGFVEPGAGALAKVEAGGLLFERALTNRWELRAWTREAERAEELAVLARGESRADVRVEGRYGRGSSGGTWDESIGLDKDVWSVGVKAEVPFQNRLAQASVMEAEIERDRVRHLTDLAVQDVFVECRTAWRAWTTARASVTAAAKALDLQQQKRDAEQIRFARGQSSTRFLLDYENDVDMAERDWIVARLDVARAHVALQLAGGDLLKDLAAAPLSSEDRE